MPFLTGMAVHRAYITGECTFFSTAVCSDFDGVKEEIEFLHISPKLFYYTLQWWQNENEGSFLFMLNIPYPLLITSYNAILNRNFSKKTPFLA